MASNIRGNGDIVRLTAPGGGVSSGDPVLIGRIFGVAQHDAAAGEGLELIVRGEVELTAATADAVTEGAALYFDGTELTTSGSGNAPVGKATTTKGGATAGTVWCLLTPDVPDPA